MTLPTQILGYREDSPVAEAHESARQHTLTIKRLIWAYFWALLLEGALRKWVLPQFSNPLLVIRDPILLLIYALALVRGLFPFNGFVIGTALLGAATFTISIISGVASLPIYMYGFHANFLHLPLIFLVPKVFDRSDVRRIGHWLMISALPMFFLVLLQFASDPSARVNVGAGGGEGGQMEVGFGRIRPPGTFSFTNGLALYLSLLAAYILYASIKSNTYPKRLYIPASTATLGMLMVSGSRGAIGSVFVGFAALGVICILRPAYAKGAATYLLIGLATFLVFQSWSLFQQGVDIHHSRFGESYADLHKGIILRFFGDFIAGFEAVGRASTFGFGLGVGTNAAAGILSGERRFLLAEAEWARVILESGPYFGFSYIALRVGMTVYLARQAVRSLIAENDNPLPALLFGACAIPLLLGQFGQPTSLGFACLGGALCLSALNRSTSSASTRVLMEAEPVGGRTLGRSSYADWLHGR